MTRRERTERYRRRLIVAIGISIGIHATVLAFVELTVPASDDTAEARPLRVVDLGSEWEESAIEVVPLETARLAQTSSAGVSSDASTAPRTIAEENSTSLPRPVRLSASPGARGLDTAPAAAAPSPEALLPRANRGIVRRSGGGAHDAEMRFVAASEAALRAERGREAEGWGDAGDGTGIRIMIPGLGGGACSGGSIPIIRQPSGGLGGVPMTGRGRGIIGARPPTSEAINRLGPRLGGGR